MFAPNVVGTANATTAGWGNMGGGVTQMVMPLILAGMVALGASTALGWRLSMVVPGVLLFVTGIAYLKLTQDTPEGNFADLRARGKLAPVDAGGPSPFLEAARDVRVWALAGIYGACFGIELTINNVAALYFHDRFELSLTNAGIIAGLFGTMNLFARTLGGFMGDRAGMRDGLRGRVTFLGTALVLQSVALIAFSRMEVLAFAVVALVVFSLFVQMAEGATFSVVPMINRRAMGAVSGMVGAGGNVGAVAAGFLFRVEGLDPSTAFLYLGLAVAASSSLVFLVRFSPAQERAAEAEMHASLRAPPAGAPATATPTPVRFAEEEMTR
jgi:MFS transporter, NNP family, nitrate/nitrite transporter